MRMRRMIGRSGQRPPIELTAACMGMPFQGAMGIPGAGGGGGSSNPIPGLSPAAYYQFNTGITSALGSVAAWADQSGNLRHLLQAVALNQPSLQGDGSILFNGTAHFLKCVAFTLNQPETVYLRFKQVIWTANDTVFDGNAGDSMRLQQITATPQLKMTVAVQANSSGSLIPLDTYVSACFLFNGASSILRVDNNTEVTGNPGAGNAGGFTLGQYGGGGVPANIQVKEVAIFAAAHDAATRASVIAYLATL